LLLVFVRLMMPMVYYIHMSLQYSDLPLGS
jgi:hypothetical protein